MGKKKKILDQGEHSIRYSFWGEKTGEGANWKSRKMVVRLDKMAQMQDKKRAMFSRGVYKIKKGTKGGTAVGGG